MSADEAPILTLFLHDIADGEELPIREIVFGRDRESIKVGRGSQTENHLRPQYNNAWFSSRVMSRDHAVLRVDLTRKTVTLEDVGSMHGTFINGHRLLPHEGINVTESDDVTFGADIVRGDSTYAALNLTLGFRWSDEQAASLQQWITGVKPSSQQEVASSIRDSANYTSRNSFSVDYSDDDQDSELENDIIYDSAPSYAANKNVFGRGLSSRSDISGCSSDMNEQESHSTTSNSLGEAMEHKIGNLSSAIIDGDGSVDDEHTHVRQASEEVTFLRAQPAGTIELDDEGSCAGYVPSHAGGAKDTDKDGSLQHAQAGTAASYDPPCNEGRVDTIESGTARESVVGSEGPSRIVQENVADHASMNQTNDLNQGSMQQESYDVYDKYQWSQTCTIPFIQDHIISTSGHIAPSDVIMWSRCSDGGAVSETPFQSGITRNYSSLCEPSGSSTLMHIPPPANISHNPSTWCGSSTAPLNLAKVSSSNILGDVELHKVTGNNKLKRKVDEISDVHQDRSPDLASDNTSVTQVPETQRSEASRSILCTTKTSTIVSIREEKAAQSNDVNSTQAIDAGQLDVASETLVLTPDSPLASTVEMTTDLSAQAACRDERPQKRIKTSQEFVHFNGSPSRTIMKYTATAVVGAILGSVSTIFGLAALPADYFA